MSAKPDEISVEQRQIIFKALVEAQDGGLSVTASRTAVARQFSVTEDQVKQIEREGSDNQWPPL
ncbi:hypothetical protein [Frigoriglobus tundricola]|uniref:Uncharacterized protein n=1 Tax=Frigoriglobus tundricola TaxID=2774151 RepID=A0A6M5YIN4_9BACT|nr:hypothetical protein [Frigoriglobus tundricola]QJW92832.1 hypothetical protein FTUN_0329 [Frigoriglobus tundricola]